jgi:predicted membrane-bound mannosyltransferase
MSAPMTIMVALTGVLLLIVIALFIRLWNLGQGGMAAILRDIPAVGGHG